MIMMMMMMDTDCSLLLVACCHIWATAAVSVYSLLCVWDEGGVVVEMCDIFFTTTRIAAASAVDYQRIRHHTKIVVTDTHAHTHTQSVEKGHWEREVRVLGSCCCCCCCLHSWQVILLQCIAHGRNTARHSRAVSCSGDCKDLYSLARDCDGNLVFFFVCCFLLIHLADYYTVEFKNAFGSNGHSIFVCVLQFPLFGLYLPIHRN